MYTGPMQAGSNRADYKFHVVLTHPETGAVIDLTGATIKVAIRDPAQSSPIIAGSNTDAHVVITAPATLGQFDVAFTKAELSVLRAGSYDFGMTILLNDGITYQEMAAELQIVDGVVSA